MIPGVTSTLKVPHFENDWGVYGKSDFSGGVSFPNGKVGIYAFKLNDYALKGQKGYYCIPDGLICLGNSLGSTTGEKLHTTVNQTLQRGEVVVKENEGKVREIIHNNIWYFLLSKGEFNYSTCPHEGSWHDISVEQVDEEVQKTIFTLSIQHTTDNSYGYAVIPNPIDVSIADKVVSGIEILRNDKDAQSIVDKNTLVLYAVFFEKGGISWNNKEIMVDKPCIIIWDMTTQKIYLAEPTQREASISLIIDQKQYNVDLPKGSYAGNTVCIEV